MNYFSNKITGVIQKICKFVQLKSIIYILSLCILACSMNLRPSDAVGLVDLYEHAQYHQEMYGDSFTDFLVKHYADNAGNHEHSDENQQTKHQELPFQHSSFHFFQLAVDSPTQFELVSVFLSIQNKNTIFSLEMGHSADFIDKLVEPPRIA